MKDLMKVIITGRLTRDPELKFLGSGTAVTKMSIASNDTKKVGGEYVEDVSFFDVTVFGKQGENCNDYLSKGRQVLVDGRLTQSRWEDNDGNKRSKVEIIAQSVMFLGNKGAKDAPTKANEQTNATVNEDDIPF